MAFTTLLAANGESLRCQSLLDTGADVCLFPLPFARALKLELAALLHALTAGLGSSKNLTYYSTLTIDLGDDIIFTAEAGFTEGLNDAGFGLLGQEGFFSTLDTTFSHRQRMVTISRL